MYARLFSAQVKSDKLDELIKVWRDMDTPEMKSEKGYRGAYLLTDRKTGKAISMTLWDSEQDAIANEQNDYIRKQVEKYYKDLLAGPLTREGYEVSAQD